MKVLLDTHFLIWLATAPGSISPKEYAAMAAREGPVMVSAISIWELRVKWHATDRDGRPKGALSAAAGLAFAEGNGFALMPLMPADCVAVLHTPCESRDPFDQMLLAHAQQLTARLLTRDTRLIGHPLAIAA